MSVSIALSILVLAAVPAAPPAAPAPREATGLATPTEEGWGDEWFDAEANRVGPQEERRIVESEAEALARARAEAEARAAAEHAERAQVRGPEARPILPPAAGFADLDVAWQERRAALLRQDREAAARAEARLFALRDELDAGELHAFAVAALRESRAHEGLPGDEAIERAELAAKLGPSLPGVQFQLARARFRAAPGEFGAWFGPLGAGFHAIAAEPRWCRPILADLAVAGLAGLLVAGAVVLVLLAIRYGRVAFHDFHHLFPRAAIPAQTAVLGALVVAAPAVLGQGPLWVGTVVAAAIWLHLARAERLVVGLWLAALGLAPFAAAPIGALVAWGEDDRGVWALERAGDFTALPALERRAAQPDARPEVLFAVARAKKRAGALEAADALYERALAARPSWPAALVNLGNVRLLRGREDEALALYGRAIAARPGLAVAYFDLSRLHYRRLDFGPGQEARNRAIELDRSLVDRYAAGERDDADPRANRYLLDVPLDARDLAGTVDRADAGLLAAVAASRLVGSIPAAAAPWTVGGILAGLLVLGLVGRNRAARSCQKCGRPVCRRCDPEVGAGELCGQCVHVYARREPVEPSDRIQKDIAVQRHAAFRRRARRALAFVLGAQVVSGRVWRGAALLAGAAALAAALWFPDGLVRPEPGGPPAFLRLALAGPALLVVWIVGVRDALGREG